MKTLLIDAGNSSLKWALLDDKNKGGSITKQTSIIYQKEEATSTLDTIISDQKNTCNNVIMVTVLDANFTKSAHKITTKNNMALRIITSSAQLAGITNAYHEPQKLGADRFVAMIASQYIINHSSAHSKAFIVIDTGTATTIDAVNAKGEHLGGVILAGLNLCTDSLLDNTKLLPLWNQSSTVFKADHFSKDTSSAISSGCLLGLASSIDGICQAMEKDLQTDEAIVKILCGGNAQKLQPYLQKNYQLEENLLMQGLKCINQL